MSTPTSDEDLMATARSFEWLHAEGVRAVTVAALVERVEALTAERAAQNESRSRLIEALGLSQSELHKVQDENGALQAKLDAVRAWAESTPNDYLFCADKVLTILDRKEDN